MRFGLFHIQNFLLISIFLLFETSYYITPIIYEVECKFGRFAKQELFNSDKNIIGKTIHESICSMQRESG